MGFLDYSHNLWVVAASLSISIMAEFTGFSRTKRISGQTVVLRTLSATLAAGALGGGCNPRRG